jgi:deazaflavin-dependent oxidoreductase (nitroreductase family)
MPEVSDWNVKIVAEFRANDGRVGGHFEGAPLLLLHHRGRRSGKEYIAPVMYLADESDPGTVYVFATNRGAPSNPMWYANLTSAARAQVDVGAQTYSVDVEDLTGTERDRIYAEQARRYPGFATYAKQTTGIRTIPVLALHRQPA